MKEAGGCLQHRGAPEDHGDHPHQAAGVTEYGQENLEYKSMLNKQLWESLNLTSALN